MNEPTMTWPLLEPPAWEQEVIREQEELPQTLCHVCALP